MENQNKNKPVKDQIITGVDKTLSKGKEIINYVENVDKMTKNQLNNLGSKMNQASKLVDNAKELGNVYLESQKIQSQTEVELTKIQKNHENINKHIDTEYKKQKQTMDKASDVVDDGLASNNIEKIREGLAAMTATANHNPMADLKRALDKDLEQDYLDDDFIIEI